MLLNKWLFIKPKTDNTMNEYKTAIMMACNDLKIKSIAPKYGVNYDMGYIGFTYYPKKIVSSGIAYFTRFERMSDIKVSHSLLVSGPDECIEAHIQNGVERSTLSKYFNDPGCQIFFRKPIDLNPELAIRMVETASCLVGAKYDLALIVAQAIQGSFLGRLINKLTGEWVDRQISYRLNNKNKWICSELTSYVMDEQPEYYNRGILALPNETISPQEHFEDEVIFKQWKKQ